MTTTPEGKLKEAARRYLAATDCWFFFPASNGFGRAGIPDIIICYRGRFIAPELKVHPNTASKYQQREIDGINAAGGRSFVIRWYPKDETPDMCVARILDPIFCPTERV